MEHRGARGHLSPGFIGTKDLMMELAKFGRNDVVCRLIHNGTFPSWGGTSPANQRLVANIIEGTVYVAYQYSTIRHH